MENKYNPLVSIIVPVYNSELYLKRCVDSILKQTYSNIEVILIDGGQIIEEYAASDARVISIHQKNKGTGPTRQKGLEISHGNYVAFIDNDDYILPDMIETMLNALEDTNSDVCACQWNYEKVVAGKICHTCNTFGIENILGVYDSITFARNLYGKGGYINGVVCSIWNKLFKKDLLLGLNIENGRGEEETVNDWVFSKDIQIVVIPNEFYYWCDNETSVTHWKFGNNQFNYLNVLHNRHRWFHDKFIKRETEMLFCNLYIEYFYKAKINNIFFPRKYSIIMYKLFLLNFSSLYANYKFYIRILIFFISSSIYRKVFSLSEIYNNN